jgi:branched-chain amino acid transport system permease protein
VKNSRPLMVILGLALYLVVIPYGWREDRYVLHVFILCSQLSIVALTVRLIFIAGELTFGQVALVMVGAYASALLTKKAELSFWLALPLSGLSAALFAAVIGYPMLRLKGTYFAMLTLILAEVMRNAARAWKFVGGIQGMYKIPRPDALKIGSFTLISEFTTHDRLPYYYLIATLFILTLLAFRRLDKSPLGAVFRAIKQDDAVAASIGVNVIAHRILAFTISAFFAGLVGSFSAHYMTVFYPDTFSVWDSIYYVLYAFIGGINYLWGPVVGCFGITWLWEVLQPIAEFQMVVFAAAIISVIFFLPGGLLSLEKFFPSWKMKLGQIFHIRGRKLAAGTGTPSDSLKEKGD